MSETVEEYVAGLKESVRRERLKDLTDREIFELATDVGDEDWKEARDFLIDFIIDKNLDQE